MVDVSHGDWLRFATEYVGVMRAGCEAAVVDSSDVRRSGAEALRDLGAVALPGPADAVAACRPGLDLEAISGGAALLFSSGTTGRPKAVQLSHHHLCEISATAIFGNGGVALPAMLVHAYAMSTTMGSWMAILPLVDEAAVTGLTAFDATLVWSAATRSETIGLCVAPWMLDTLSDRGTDGVPASLVERLAGVMTVTSPLSEHVLARFVTEFPRVPVIDYYGATEVGEAGTAVLCGTRSSSGCGLPLPGTEVAIHGADGRTCPPGVPGRIAMRMPGIPAPVVVWGEGQGEARGEWAFPGDTGYLDADGALHLVGREADAIWIGGEAVSLAQVEDAVISATGAQAAIVVQVAGPDSPLTALIEGPRSTDWTTARARLAGTLRSAEVPATAAWVDELPRSANGKLSRSAARRLLD